MGLGIFTTTSHKICEGGINVHNCFGSLLVLSRQHLTSFIKSNATDVKASVNDKSNNCIEVILVRGYSLEDIVKKLNLSRNEARLVLREALNKLKH